MYGWTRSLQYTLASPVPSISISGSISISISVSIVSISFSIPVSISVSISILVSSVSSPVSISVSVSFCLSVSLLLAQVSPASFLSSPSLLRFVASAQIRFSLLSYCLLHLCFLFFPQLGLDLLRALLSSLSIPFFTCYIKRIKQRVKDIN